MKGRRTDWKKSGIYSIICTVNGKQYIGCSNNIYRRINMHKSALNLKKLNQINEHILNDWKNYGSESFDYTVLEYTDTNLKDKEFEYITKLNTIDRNIGYNLRRDSLATGMLALDETRNKYSIAMKRRFSRVEERLKIGEISSKFWKNNPEIKKSMAKKVSDTLTKYTIKQFTKTGEFIKEWNKVKDIIYENPTYKVHNIYAACSGEKPSMYGYVWTKCKIKI